MTTKQGSLFDQPVAHARKTDPITSHEAAAKVTKLTEKQMAVYACLLTFGVEGATDVDIKRVYENLRVARGWPKQSESGLRTRRNELFTRRPQRVEEHGTRAIGKYNHTIWRAV